MKNLTGIYQDLLSGTSKYNDQIDYVDAQAVSGQADVDVGDGANFLAGEEVIIYDGEGSFESAIIDSISSNVLTMTANLTNTYPEGSYIGKYLGYLDTTNNKYQRLLAPDLGNGSDGAFVSSGNETWSAEKNYTSITILNGHTITIDDNIAIKCQGTCDIQSGGKISAKGEGHAGGAKGTPSIGTQGTSQLGVGGGGYVANGGGGGGGAYGGANNRVGGGGGGGYKTVGENGYQDGSNPDNTWNGRKGGVYNDEELTTFTIAYLKGSGGGGGCSQATNTGGLGGDGGGIIRLHCLNFICAGEIDCDGNDGDQATEPIQYTSSGGGGGAGGTVYIQAVQLTILGTALIHSNGGIGGYGNIVGGTPQVNFRGGYGGDGRIRIESSKITGTTDPTYATDYANDRGAFGKYGFYHTAEIKTLNEIVTANAYIKQEIVRSANIAGATSSGQKDVIVDDASVYNAGDKIVLIEDDKMELHEIDSISSNTLTLVDNLVNSFTASGDALGIDNYPSVSIEPVGDDESQVEMVLQTVENLGDDIWYFTYSKTVRVDNTPASGEAGVRLVGRVRLQGKDNDTTDINLTEINWSFY